MRAYLFFLLISVLIFIFPGFCQEHDKIVEKVSVNWWQVPIFAVDKSGNAVADLKEEDIDLWMNNQRIKAFTLLKRSYSVTQQEEKVPGQPPVIEKMEEQAPRKKKVLFLLFDVTLSDKVAIKRSKKIAETILMNADKNTRFIILTIEPFVGLTYIGETTNTKNNKTKLVQMVKDKVIERTNIRSVDPERFIVQIKTRTKGGDAFTKEEMRSFKAQASKNLQRKSFSFFNSFETLYFFMSSMEENKFIYLFSEGPSLSVITSIPGGRVMYNYLLKKVANYLGRCGAVLFVVNPMGVTPPMDMTIQKMGLNTEKYNPYSKISGEDSLRYLAHESGGKYMEGVKEEIAKKLEDMHRAYYEISFPDIPGSKGSSRKITVRSKRKDVSIHSLRSLERRKRYKEMETLEKELLALNLITRNPLIKTNMSVYNARIDKIKRSKKKVVYRITIPDSYLYKTVDLYKFWITNDREMTEVAKVEKESLRPGKTKMKIEFKIKRKGKEKDESDTYFVLVSGTMSRALVSGIAGYEEDPEIAKLEMQKERSEKIVQIKPGEMKRILEGAAGYCETLKKSAFHFFCIEKISETKIPLTPSVKRETALSLAVALRRPRARDVMLKKVYPKVNRYVFTYRLIKKGTTIKEEREWMSSKDNNSKTNANNKLDKDNVIKPTAFMTEKAIFAPLTLLLRERQDKYHFRFIRFDKRKGRSAAVIEGIPKKREETAAVYGRIWIDREDFSVLKIEADPTSIRGYDRLKKHAVSLATKLDLSLETEFDEIFNGIRFPTRVRVVEKYKGGTYISRLRGARGWERSRTVFTYNDYQFFDVQLEVAVH